MDGVELWPEIKPFSEDYLSVSDIHTVRFALYGNPDGEPVFFLHGGPGGGCDDDDARWFNPERYLIITHDQRGSGKSKPFGEIADNTTQDLIDDINKLREYLNISKPISIFAGSWGTTLALLYAEAFPKYIKRMILRGIFTCGYFEQDYFYSQDGAARFSPEAWDKLIKIIPDGNERLQERIHRLIENSDDAGRRKWCTALAEYDYSFFNISEEDFEKEMNNFNRVYSEMRINIYYQANRFFLKDNQILDNADNIKNVPVTIIHGRNDMICLPVDAWNLHKKLPVSKLMLIPNAGHLSGEPFIKQALLKAVNDWD